MCLSYDGHVAFYFLPNIPPLYPGKNLKAPHGADIIEHRRKNDGTKGKRIMKMQKMEPKILTCMKGYGAGQFKKDVTAGILVAVIAFPLSVALAIASGMSPERGLYSAVIGGFFVSLLGGSKVNIGGATAATVMWENIKS